MWAQSHSYVAGHRALSKHKCSSYWHHIQSAWKFRNKLLIITAWKCTSQLRENPCRIWQYICSPEIAKTYLRLFLWNYVRYCTHCYNSIERCARTPDKNSRCQKTQATSCIVTSSPRYTSNAGSWRPIDRKRFSTKQPANSRGIKVIHLFRAFESLQW